MGVARLASVAIVVAAATAAPAQIVWSDGVVTARGRGIPNELTRNLDAARAAAERRAREDAIRAALALVEATPLGGAQTVGEALAAEPSRRERVLAAWRRADPVDRTYFSNDAVVAHYRFPLASVLDALGPASAHALNGALPIVVDARRLDPAPVRALAPRILDLEGHEAYGPAEVSGGHALGVRYVEKPATETAPPGATIAERLGGEPSTLVVRDAGGIRRMHLLEPPTHIAIWVRPR